MNTRLSEIRARLRQKLYTKTNWGRNELFSLIDEVLIEVADSEFGQAYLVETKLDT